MNERCHGKRIFIDENNNKYIGFNKDDLEYEREILKSIMNKEENVLINLWAMNKIILINDFIEENQ
jgi:hypothetical protein